MEIGKKIKALRVAKGTTQEKLAEYLMVSYQAVSKWENDQAAPDISLLPKLSTYFGITIDELFHLEGSTHFERIENMLRQQRQLTEEEEAYAKRFLTEQLHNDGQAGRVHGLLARLYNYKAKHNHDIAKEHALKALALEPTQKSHHVNLVEACRGAFEDWNYVNHHDLIAYYMTFVGDNPDYRGGYLWLLDQLLADYRTAEAREVLEKLKNVDSGHIVMVYEGRILKREGNMTEALHVWEEMVKTYPNEWLAHANLAEELTMLGRYEEALAVFDQAMEIQPKPRYYDGYESMAHIYEILNQPNQAIEQYERIIALLKNEWQITFGEGVERHLRAIEKLK